MRLFRVQRVAGAGRGAHGVLLQSLPRAARGGIAVSRCAPMEGGGREGGTWCECAARLVPILTSFCAGPERGGRHRLVG